MSRKDNTSLLVRGVPRLVLDALDDRARKDATTKNAIAQRLIANYAAGRVTPKAPPPAFDPSRKAAAPHPANTAELALSGIDNEVFGRFMQRAKAEGWFSKNALIVELLRTVIE